MWSDHSLWFWFAFPWWLVILSIFSYAYWPFVCLLWRNVCSGPLPVFYLGCLSFLMLSCVNPLDILDINPSSDLSFVNIFSHSVVCLFVLLMVSFAVQKLFRLMPHSFNNYIICWWFCQSLSFKCLLSKQYIV